MADTGRMGELTLNERLRALVIVDEVRSDNTLATEETQHKK